MTMLDGIREQLGIRIQPGKDKSNINTSLPKGKVTIFIDNLNYLESTTWLATDVTGNKILDVNLAIVIGMTVKSLGWKKSDIDDSINNWIEVKGLSYSDKKTFLNEEIGFNPPHQLVEQLSAVPDSRLPMFMKLLSLGLKRFCFQLASVKVPKNMQELYIWLHKKALHKYGDVVQQAVLVIYDQGGLNMDLWRECLRFSSKGIETNITDYELMKIESALHDWAIIKTEDDVITLDIEYKKALSSITYKPTTNSILLAACKSILNSKKLDGTKIESHALNFVSKAFVNVGQKDDARKLLADRGFVQRAGRLGLLTELVKQFNGFGIQNWNPRGIKILFQKIQKYPHLINSILFQAAWHAGNLLPSWSLEKDEVHFKIEKSRMAIEKYQAVTSKSVKFVKKLNDDSFIVVLDNGTIWKTCDIEWSSENIIRVKFPSLDVNSMSISIDRILICSSFYAVLYDHSFVTISNLRLDAGPVIDSATNDEFFGTIHHGKRVVILWRGKDGKRMWQMSLNSIPSSINFNLSKSVYNNDCLLVGLWKGSVEIFNLDDGKVMGRIHSSYRSSVTAVSLITENSKPFIITGWV